MRGGRLSASHPFHVRSLSRPVKGKIVILIAAKFRWLKNLAPLEKNRRTRIRNKEYWSKMVIVDLDVLDSGYYQCTASNVAGSVNTTSVLRVG